MLETDGRLRSYPDSQPQWTNEPFAEGFDPDYTPQQMIKMGIFGDAYFGDALGRSRVELLPNDWQFKKGMQFYTNHRGKQCAWINYFGRPASQSRDWWLDRGMIVDIDPLGWFEWYCHYYLGRRVARYDEWQISRWKNYRSRQMAMYRSNKYPGTAQALLHWAISVHEELI